VLRRRTPTEITRGRPSVGLFDGAGHVVAEPVPPLQLRRHALVSLAEWNAFRHHEPVSFFGRVNRGIELYAVGPELHRVDGGLQDVESLHREVDAAEQRELQQLQVALVAGRQLGADASASVRQACALAERPRMSSKTSGLRFCGMIEEPVVKASGSSTKPNSCV
jgi:hypothetical protein